MLVVTPVTPPADLAGLTNGDLPATLLTQIGPRGYLHHTVARAWRALTAEALTAGWELTYTYGGTYRTYTEQTALFMSRYTMTVLPGRPTKTWNGQTWYQKPNTAMAAVPGTSNHGWALAIDTALGTGPNTAKPITPAIDWLATHAPRYGFSWEG
jgi:LAS superfamily LD-carboxypeptidase LdcB